MHCSLRVGCWLLFVDVRSLFLFVVCVVCCCLCVTDRCRRLACFLFACCCAACVDSLLLLVGCCCTLGVVSYLLMHVRSRVCCRSLVVGMC